MYPGYRIQDVKPIVKYLILLVNMSKKVFNIHKDQKG